VHESMYVGGVPGASSRICLPHVGGAAGCGPPHSSVSPRAENRPVRCVTTSKCEMDLTGSE